MSLLLSALQQAAQAHRAATAAQRMTPTPYATAAARRQNRYHRLGILLIGMAGGALVVAPFMVLERQGRPTIEAAAGLPQKPSPNLAARKPMADITSRDVQAALPAPVVQAISEQIAPYVKPRVSAPAASPIALSDQALQRQPQPRSTPPPSRAAPDINVSFARESSPVSPSSATAEDSPAAALARGEYQNALNAYNAILASDPGNTAALSGRTRALALQANRAAQRGDVETAQQAQQQAWALERDNPAWRLNLAILADRRGDWPQALALYQQAQIAYTKAEGRATLPPGWSKVQARIAWLERQTQTGQR